MTNEFLTDLGRLDQIRRAHTSARPKQENPAWMNCHNDTAFLLEFIEKLWLEYSLTLSRLDNKAGDRI